MIGHQEGVFIGLIFARQHAALLAFGMDEDEILAAAVPALARRAILLRRLVVEPEVFRLAERSRRRCLRGCGSELGPRISGVIHA
jgi:hypothetical protein